MELEPKTYNRMNLAQISDAKKTIRNILVDGFGTVATIVDIGCGTGNVTQLMGDAISHERILALDVDPEMIKLASQKSLPHIDFLVQDIAVPFEQLVPKLQEYEGKVDLVWSNRMLHWVPEKDRLQTVKNILRLLKSGGKAYINTTFTPNWVAALPEEEGAVVSKLIRIPSKDEQELGWVHCFRGADANAVNITLSETSQIYESPEDLRLSRDFIHCYCRYLADADQLTQNEKDTFLEPYKDYFWRCCAGPISQPSSRVEVDSLSTYRYALFHIVVTK